MSKKLLERMRAYLENEAQGKEGRELLEDIENYLRPAYFPETAYISFNPPAVFAEMPIDNRTYPIVCQYKRVDEIRGKE